MHVQLNTRVSTSFGNCKMRARSESHYIELMTNFISKHDLSPTKWVEAMVVSKLTSDATTCPKRGLEHSSKTTVAELLREGDTIRPQPSRRQIESRGDSTSETWLVRGHEVAIHGVFRFAVLQL